MIAQQSEKVSRLTHYLKSPLASIKTVSETLQLKSIPAQKNLFDSLEDSLNKLNFRLELYTNSLLFERKLEKYNLEFFKLSDLIKKISNKELFFTGTTASSEVLADKALVELLLNYGFKLVGKTAKSKRVTINLSKKGKNYSLLLSPTLGQKSLPAVKTDEELEQDLLRQTLNSLAKQLNGGFKEIKKRDSYQIELTLPEKFSL